MTRLLPVRLFRTRPVDEPWGVRLRLYLMLAGLAATYYGIALLVGLEPEPQLMGIWRGSADATLLLGLPYTVVILMWTLLQMPPSYSELGRLLRGRLLSAVFLERVLGVFFIMVALNAIYNGYGAFKPAFPEIRGEPIDQALAGVDKLLHLGVDPWRWLHALPARGAWTAFLDWFYLTWFPVMAVVLWAVLLVAPFGARIRFFLGYALVLVVGGTLLAVLLWSGGPVYFGGFTGDEERFAPLLDYLAVAAPRASGVQAYLWEAYTVPEAEGLFQGISAMPSLHVTVTAYYVFAAQRVGPMLTAVAAIYAFLTLVGSVHLGWHYAVDGYIGAVVAWGAWRFAQRVTSGSGAITEERSGNGRKKVEPPLSAS